MGPGSPAASDCAEAVTENQIEIATTPRIFMARGNCLPIWAKLA